MTCRLTSRLGWPVRREGSQGVCDMALTSEWDSSRLLSSIGEEDEADLEFKPNRDSVVFCIDLTSSMLHAPSSDEPCALTQALRAIYNLMKRKIIGSPADHVGILLFNAKKRSTIEEPVKSIYTDVVVLQDVGQLDAPAIKTLKKLFEDVENDPDYYSKTYKSTREAQQSSSLSRCLNAARQILAERSPKGSYKRIFLVTDDDDPFPSSAPGHAQLRLACETHLKDAAEMGYELLPCFIDTGSGFDVDKFYADPLSKYYPNEAIPDLAQSGIARLERLEAHMRVREAPKRVVFTIDLILFNDFAIGVNGYTLCAEEHKRPPTNIDGRSQDGAEVQPRTNYTDIDTGRTITDPAEQLQHYYTLGTTMGRGSFAAAGTDDRDDGDYLEARADVSTSLPTRAPPQRKIVLTDDEIDRVRTCGMKPSLRMLGFKPRRELLPEHHRGHAYFIFPTDAKILGSKRTFLALIRSMCKKDVVGYACFMPRANSVPVIAALLPQLEQLDEYGRQSKPAGMHVIQLPYADDIRSINLTATRQAIADPDAEEQPAIDAAFEIIRKMNIKAYFPDNFPNPALNHHYNCLAATALDEEWPEVDDRTLPAYQVIDSRFGEHLKKLKRIVEEHPEALKPALVKPGAKRKLTYDEINKGQTIIDAYEGGKLQKLTKDQLIAFLEHYDQDTKGNKGPLLERTEAVLEAEGLIKPAKKRKTR
ncbi:uncharacterized protein L969DRAFT_101792 [Mixia osmundae IAM 14324]|uniref:ATP-dependent DNA helicase II subunit 1 n=1 Tax=Mixia osmundae (strain CBS 9802 / IAM 14324 / JCM 22182 / KY 12970) TaxID=764103 RepID=G7DYN8_MIXOS|nr:uncharacterized protein L969DRAFT_101792 [Mixia osmundae IAM 14324]KEI41597.1 hypothetical protein L969DRAFT_101792 [Mixia osmundae IAM 14324]GAA95698.1 hypothetical protein E5Q_02355 [Mixia osmundae IAM 14324]